MTNSEKYLCSENTLLESKVEIYKRELAEAKKTIRKRNLLIKQLRMMNDSWKAIVAKYEENK